MYRLGKHPTTNIVLQVDDGIRIHKLWADLEHTDDYAEAFHYKWGKRERIVLIPHDATPRWEAVPWEPIFQSAPKDFRMFGVRNGEWQALGLDKTGSRISLDQLSSFTLDNTAVKLSKAFKDSGMPVKWILVIGALIIAAVAGYYFISSQGKSKTPPATPPPAVTQMVDYGR